MSASEAFCRTTAALPESAPTLILHPNNFSSEFREWCRGRMPRQDAGNTLQITGTRSSLTSGKLPKNIFKTICTLSSTSRRWVLCPVFFFVGSYDGREEEKSVTYRAAGSGRGARVSALCPDQRTLGGK